MSDDPLETIRNSPEFQARERQREEARHRMAAALAQAEQPLLEELERSGAAVRSAWDLVSWSRLPSEVVDVLLRHVSKPYPGRVVEGIARALARPEARRGWPILALEFRRRASSGDADEGLAVALSAIADDQVMDELIGLAAEPALGANRIHLLRALKESRRPEARTALEAAVADPQLAAEATALLARIRKVT